MTDYYKTLEACDKAVLQSLGQRNLAIKSYCELGLNNREISERLHGLGVELSANGVSRITRGMRKQGVVQEKAPSRTTEWRHQRKVSVSNVRDAQMKQPDPLLETLKEQIKEQRAKTEPSILGALRQPVEPRPNKKVIRVEVTTKEPRQRVAEELAGDYSYTQISEEDLDKDLGLLAGEYGKILAKLKDAATELNCFLQGLEHSHGTRILDDVRQKASHVGGLASADLDLVLESVDKLRDVYEMASSSNPPKILKQS